MLRGSNEIYEFSAMGRNKMTGRSGQMREPPRFIRVFCLLQFPAFFLTETRGSALADSRREGETFMRYPARVLRHGVQHQFQMGSGAANQLWSNSGSVLSEGDVHKLLKLIRLYKIAAEAQYGRCQCARVCDNSPLRLATVCPTRAVRRVISSPAVGGIGEF
jgi:hypothetical protein